MKALFPSPFAASSNYDGQQTEIRWVGLCHLSLNKFPGHKRMTFLAKEIIWPLNWLAAPPANALLTFLAVGDPVALALSCGFGVGR